jgi:short-subunit dehydrogenase
MGYGLSKAALIHLADNLRADLGNKNIHIHIINPGFVATRLTAKNDFPMPLIITPEKAAQYIMRGLTRNDYAIDFPRRFSMIFKILRLLPNGIYFWLLQKIRF